MEHITRAYGADVGSPKCHNRYRGAFSRHELDLERVVGVPMDDRAHITLLETELGKGPP